MNEADPRDGFLDRVANRRDRKEQEASQDQEVAQRPDKSQPVDMSLTFEQRCQKNAALGPYTGDRVTKQLVVHAKARRAAKAQEREVSGGTDKGQEHEDRPDLYRAHTFGMPM